VERPGSDLAHLSRLATVTHFNVLVLGAGPGGYVAAIRAAQLGQSVAVIEEKYWGGVCLNVGCIPSKALLRNAEIAHIITKEKDTFGISGEATMDFGATHKRSRGVAEASAKGVHYLMKKNKITELDGWGTIKSPTEVEVDKDGQKQTHTCDNLIIATGAKVRMLPGMSVSQNVVTYEEQILTDQLPSSIIIGGSGAIGVEFAYVHGQLRRGRDDRGVPRPDGADRGRRRLQGAAQAVQEARREGPALHQGRPGRGHRLRGPRDGQSPPAAATARSSRPTRCSPRSASRRASTATAWRTPA